MPGRNRIMRKILSLICVFVLLLAVSSCAGKTASAEKRELVCPEDVKTLFSVCPHPDDVIADCAVDFNLMPDFKGLTKKTVTDEETGTKTDEWYNSRGEKVYSVSVDQGENRYDYYTQTKSGKDLALTYSRFEDTGELDWVNADTDGVSISFSEISDGKAGNIYIEEYLPGSTVEYIAYHTTDDRWAAESAIYYAEEGLMRLYGFLNGNPEEFITEPVAEKVNNIEVSDVGDLQDVVPLQFRAGKHTVCYTEDESGRQWYLTAAFIIQFNSMQEAEDFSEKYGLPEPDYDSLDGETPQIITDKYTLKVSPEFAETEGFAGFVTMEFNDDYSLILSLDENGEITDFDIGYTQFY